MPLSRPRRSMGDAMTAVVLAGGLGTRMGSLTRDVPKHLLEVAGEPFIVHQLRWLASNGVTDVILATAHLAEQFEPVLGDGRRWGVHLRYSTEHTPLGTGGGLAQAARLLDPDPDSFVVVVNGDLLTRHDLRRQVEHARANDRTAPDAVLHLRTVPDARDFGSAVAGDEGRVVAFVEKSTHPPSREVNAGTYVLRRSVVDGIPPGVVSLEHDVLPVLVERGRVVAYREQALWEDVGTPAALVRASRKLVADSGLAARVDPSAVVDASAHVGDGSAIGAGAVIGSGVSVVGSVVMTRARLHPGTTVRHSVVGPGADVAGGVFEGQVLT